VIKKLQKDKHGRATKVFLAYTKAKNNTLIHNSGMASGDMMFYNRSIGHLRGHTCAHTDITIYAYFSL
jgi:hypothetical protein